MRILAALSLFMVTLATAQPRVLPPPDPQSPLFAYHELGVEIGLDYLAEQGLSWGNEVVNILPADFSQPDGQPHGVAGLSYWQPSDGVIGVLPGLQGLDNKLRQHFENPIVIYDDVSQMQALSATVQPNHQRRFRSAEEVGDLTGPVLVFWTGDLPDLSAIEADRLYILSRFVNPASLEQLAPGSRQLVDWHPSVERSEISDFLILESLKRAQRYPDAVVEAAFRSVLVAFELSQGEPLANRAVNTASGLLRYDAQLMPNAPLLVVQKQADGWQFLQRW